MAHKTTYYCDGCGAEKKEVNHWWIADDHKEFVIFPFDPIDIAVDSKLYCGQSCVLKAVSEYMEKVRTGG